MALRNSTKHIKRIGLVTGGGDCPGLNAAIRAVVKAAIIKYDWEVYGIQDGFSGLILDRYFRLDLDRVRGILPRGGTILGSSRRFDPFALKDPTIGINTPVDKSRQALEQIERLGLDGLIVLGGDGTFKIANRFHQLGVPIVGIPKTIDKDVVGTDTTIGFSTAAVTVTDALDKLHTTAESHHRVMAVEVMGNTAGWLALETGIAGGADVILIPEIPFDLDLVCEKVKQRNKAGRLFSVVVAAEGAREKDGSHFYRDERRLNFGGIGQFIAVEVEKMTNLETRSIVLGHLQRGGSPTAFDRILATRFGVSAVQAMAEGMSGVMICFRNRAIDYCTLEEAASATNLVDPDSDLIRTAECLDISVGR